MLQRTRQAIGEIGTVGVIAIALLLALAFYLGSLSSQVAIRTGVPHAAEGAISIVTDEWTYAVPLDGVAWMDERGSWHESGRPACLEPGTTAETVRFGAVTSTIEGTTWRPVVWVDCR